MTFCIREQPLFLRNFGILQWRDVIKEAYDGLDSNHSHMKGIKLFGENFISSCRFDEFQEKALIVAKVKAEMKKNKIYDVTVEIDLESNEILYGACSCRAGTNPASCKHVFALFAFLEGYSSKEMYKAPTEKLQTWHQPAPKKLLPMTATEMFSKDNNDYPVAPVNMQALLKLSKRAQIFCAIDCSKLFLDSSIPLPAVVFSGSNLDCLPQTLGLDEIIFLHQKVLGSIQDFTEIERKTTCQSDCKMWFDERKCRLTASSFHKIIHCKSNLPELCHKLFDAKNNSLEHIPAVKYGIDMEPIVRRKVQGRYHQYLLRKCGLVVNPQFPYLGASPDGLLMMEEPVLIEIKTVFNPKGLSLQELCVNRKDFCLVEVAGQLKLKQNHSYFTQIQGQLGVSNLQKCLFVLYAPPNDLFIEEINFNKVVWQSMLSELKIFYFQHYLPYICNKC